MVQFNLLPDVKMHYIKARKQKRFVMLVSFISGATALGLLTLMMVYVFVVQAALIATYQRSINKSLAAIKTKNNKVDDIDKVLTVQNQLNSLDKLHADKPVMSRLFGYLTKLTPSQVTISKVTLNDEDSSMLLQGSTDTLETVNKFVDTLKFSNFIAKGSTETQQVFTDVVLKGFSRDKEGASYTITMTYDPIIFEGEQDPVGLVVPQKTTTRSELGRPIFQTESEAINNAPEPTEGSD